MTEKRMINRFQPGAPWCLTIIFLVVLPYTIIYATPYQEAITRAIAISGYCIAMPFSFIVYSLHPNSRIYNKYSASHQAGLPVAQRKFELFIRGIILLLGLGAAYSITWPYCRGMVSIVSGGQLVQLQGKVQQRSDLWGTYFLYQSFRLGGIGARSCMLLYFPQFRLENGQLASVLVLPNSTIIVAVTAVSDS